MAGGAMNRARRRRRPRYRVRWGRFLLTLLLLVALCVAAVYYIFLYPKQVEQINYPLAYEDTIDRYAKEYGLDPARVAAVIYCESSFRADALSGAGAMGLMQIMPSTGEWIASKLGEADYTEASLNVPDTNIRYGCWYLNYLENRFDGDLTKVTAAYHAGGGKVDEWLDDKAYSADGVTLTALPDNATGRYVQNVRAAYAKYKEIMDT